MGSSGGSRGMVSISLFVELLRTRPRLLFWSMAALQLVLWTLVPFVFYSAPPGQLPLVLAIGHDFQLGTDFGPPLAFWLAELAYRAMGMFGVYLLSQISIVVTFWAVLALGRAVVGEVHAAMAVLLMAGVAVFSVPTPEFGPAILAAPLWALLLYHYWRAAGGGDFRYWLAVGIDAGLLLLTTYAGLILLGLVVGVALGAVARTLGGDAENPNWLTETLTIVGTGPLEPRLRKLLPTACFLGPQTGTQLAHTLATFDIFIHPGEFETFCQTIQEAHAAGVALASRVVKPLNFRQSPVAHDQRREAVGQDGAEHQPQRPRPGHTRRGHVFPLLLGHHRGARQPHEVRLQHERDGDHRIGEAGPQNRHQHQGQQQQQRSAQIGVRHQRGASVCSFHFSLFFSMARSVSTGAKSSVRILPVGRASTRRSDAICRKS